MDERALPVRDDVQGACEMLGLDPIDVANEGRFIAVVAPEDADPALEIMRQHDGGRGACLIEYVGEAADGLVVLTSRIGVGRIVDMLSGEQLPRIC